MLGILRVVIHFDRIADIVSGRRRTIIQIDFNCFALGRGVFNGGAIGGGGTPGIRVVRFALAQAIIANSKKDKGQAEEEE